MRKMIFVLFSVIILCSCTSESSKPSSNLKSSKPLSTSKSRKSSSASENSKPLCIGEYFDTKYIKKEKIQIMTSSSSIEEVYKIFRDGIEYDIALDEKNLIHYIDTIDPDFVTPEGLKMGDKYKVVKKRTDSIVWREAGYAYYIEFPSGWRAGFVQGRTLTEGEVLSDEAEIKWFYKRSW
jgi:hypothetical protein